MIRFSRSGETIIARLIEEAQEHAELQRLRAELELLRAMETALRISLPVDVDTEAPSGISHTAGT